MRLQAHAFQLHERPLCARRRAQPDDRADLQRPSQARSSGTSSADARNHAHHARMRDRHTPAQLARLRVRVEPCAHRACTNCATLSPPCARACSKLARPVVEQCAIDASQRRSSQSPKSISFRRSSWLSTQPKSLRQFDGKRRAARQRARHHARAALAPASSRASKRAPRTTRRAASASATSLWP